MAESHKVTVLLADEDSLRRDGLAAVLKGNPEIEVVAGCADGQTALDEIRDLRPDVAVLDLNLPGLHGIELVRRVRGEALGTKVIIMSGTMDDEIVREVVRAGADAYLLKNGPARHLTDAISYVRDGGQYFSPQLRRDGRDRHLLEEPPRQYPESARSSETRRATQRHTADPGRLRERIRGEASPNLRDRDYEIMEEMADGIRPILDRLDEIENRVTEMEAGDEPVPADPRGWLSAQMADTVQKPGLVSSRDVEARLPELIEEAVDKRFRQMAGKLQEEIEETHIRTLENFVRNVQVKLVQRVSALEQNAAQQADAMHQLREYNQRTEDNLSRLLTGVDRLAQDLPKRLAAAQSGGAQQTESEPATEYIATKSSRGVRHSHSKNVIPKIFWGSVAAIILIYAGIRGYSSISGRSSAGSANIPASSEGSKLVRPAKNADTKTKLEVARQFMERKEYSTAEDIYKQVTAAEPNNVDALKGLASVLYREDKIDESAAVLDRLPKN
jgi:DNA-binding NarL/FixJ family response regulator